jgi:hypothetical protein
MTYVINRLSMRWSTERLSASARKREEKPINQSPPLFGHFQLITENSSTTTELIVGGRRRKLFEWCVCHSISFCFATECTTNDKNNDDTTTLQQYIDNRLASLLHITAT